MLCACSEIFWCRPALRDADLVSHTLSDFSKAERCEDGEPKVNHFPGPLPFSLALWHF